MAMREIFQKAATQIYMDLRYFLFFSFFVFHHERKNTIILRIYFAEGDSF